MIREEVSKILGIRIEKGYWNTIFKNLDVSGGITQRKLLEIIILLCQKMEAIEDGKESTVIQSA